MTMAVMIMSTPPGQNTTIRQPYGALVFLILTCLCHLRSFVPRRLFTGGVGHGAAGDALPVLDAEWGACYASVHVLEKYGGVVPEASREENGMMIS